MVPKNCVICETQVDGKVMERHMGKRNMEGIKLSNDMKEAIKTRCLICKETFIVNKMRVHVKAKHQITITEYKEKQLMGAPYKLVERVFHRYVNMFTMHHFQNISTFFNRCQLCQVLLLLDSDAIASHLSSHSGMTHAKYNSLFMNVSSRPNSVERPVSVERPTQRPASAGQHLVGERPGKGGVAGQQRGNLPIPGQQGQMRLSRPVGQPVRKSQGLWAASERQGGGEDDIEVVKEVEAGELKKQRVKELTIKEKKRADSWNEPLDDDEEEIVDSSSTKRSLLPYVIRIQI